MIVYNVTCNVAPDIEKRWLEWIDLQLDNLSKSEKISATSILKLNNNSSENEAVYALQYQIYNRDSLQSFLNNEDNFSDQDWKNLYELAEDTFVEETDSLKEGAAGAGLTDND